MPGQPPHAAARTEAGGGATVGIAAACCGLVLTALPIFLVGGLAVQIRAELGFSEAALGAAVSGALITGACAAPVGGRLADRIGARAAVLSGGALSVLALAGIAGLARSWGHLALLLAVAGLGLAITDPGLAVLVSRAVPVTRQGLAFGVKEASIPITTLTAGLAVPGIALTLGWRWAFALALLPLAGLLWLLRRIDLSARPDPVPGNVTVASPNPRSATETSAGAGAAGADPQTARPSDRAQAHGSPFPEPSRATLVLVGVAAALGMVAASGVGVFLTQSAVAMGLSPANAGLLLAGGSVAGITARIATGIVADRGGGQQLGLIAWMLAAGAAAMAVGASGAGPLLVVGTVGAFAAGWGWSGLLFFSLVRANPRAPGAAAGIGVAGLATGNGLGPLLFGLTAEQLSFRAAWIGAALVAVLAALLMQVANRRFAP